MIVLSSVLQKLVNGNDRNHREKAERVTKFHALRPPSISVKDYLHRICKYASCSAECFVLALVYIDRLIQQADFTISSLNIHRVVVTSVMLAAKFFDDHYYNNAYYAKIGGVPCLEMNALELEFLFLINFSLYVEPQSYNKYYSELCNHAFLVSPSASWTLGTARLADNTARPSSSSTTNESTSMGIIQDDARRTRRAWYDDANRERESATRTAFGASADTYRRTDMDDDHDDEEDGMDVVRNNTTGGDGQDAVMMTVQS